MARPLLFKTSAELEAKIAEYFQYCKTGKMVKHINRRGQSFEFRQEIPPTIEGMALYLNCSSRTLREYAKRDGFFPVISRARMRIYGAWVRRGLTGEYNPHMVVMLLKAQCPEYRVR
jgi:hypothetical protein